MAKHLVPAQPVPPTRVVHYVDPNPRPELVLYSAAELLTRRQAQQLAYQRWLVRRMEIANRDRRVRRFWLGFGAVVGTAVLITLALLGWLAYHAVTATGLGLLAIPLAVLLLGGLAAGGHRCITTIQHWH